MHKMTLINNISSLKMSSIYSPSRLKRKINKKSSSIGKKLCAINKKIVNANEVINQPDKFYMNLFNNILQKAPNMSNDKQLSKNEKKSREIN